MRSLRAYAGRAVALACLLTATAAASGEELRTRLSNEDRGLINDAGMDYSGCLQEQAMSHVNEENDVRQVAARAVEDCSNIMDSLRQQLDERRIDPDYYQGILRHIKTRAIRQVMPSIMMYKAQSADADSDQ